jgi:hypothetical protein
MNTVACYHANSTCRSIGVQAYFRVKTRTPGGAVRCLTQPPNDYNTMFQDCLADAKDSTQTFFIEGGDT